MTLKIIKTTAVAAVLAVAGYWYWSPLLTVRQMQSAAQTKDAEAFNEHVDYPKLRESLKDQFSAFMGVTPENSGNGLAALGAMLGRAVATPFVDAMVRPETVMRAMQYGQLSPKDKQPSDAPASSSDNSGSPAKAEPQEDKTKWTYERKGMDKIIAYATDPKKPDVPDHEKFGVVFQRSGFADWKLTAFKIPAINK